MARTSEHINHKDPKLENLIKNLYVGADNIFFSFVLVKPMIPKEPVMMRTSKTIGKVVSQIRNSGENGSYQLKYKGDDNGRSAKAHWGLIINPK